MLTVVVAATLGVSIDGFVLLSRPKACGSLAASKGFGTGSSKKKTKSKKLSFIDAINDNPKPSKSDSVAKPYVKSEHDDLIASLAMSSSKTAIGQAVASGPYSGTSDADPFWELMPSLLSSRFPMYKDDQLQRVAGMVRYAVNPNLPLEDSIIEDPYRPHREIHAYMPGLGPTKPFYDPEQLPLCQRLSENYDVILKEYEALLQDAEISGKDRFQSVTSMNYESGWRTLVLFYNGHRIPGFPYHLCPVTTRLLESVPLAGRIAGFNRQRPQTGIPLHSDGNNMWLTCQMGVIVPDDEMAYIRVGPEVKRWKKGECLLYDTTYEHETKNEHPDQERVVLHVDFFNTLAMTPIEIEVMQYVYNLREEFMKAEGVAKVGAHIL
jgi:aspartyl/asparaginyl beta-hydroxylase (cupin superfamily)